MKDFPLELEHASGVTMSLERDRVLVGLKPQAAATGAADVLDRLDLMPEPTEVSRGAGKVADKAKPRPKLNQSETRVWARTKSGMSFDAHRLDDPDARAELGGLEWVAPVYNLPTAHGSERLSILPHRLLIKPAKGQTRRQFAKEARSLGLLEDAERSKYLGEFGLYEVEDPLDKTAIDVLATVMDKGPGFASEARFETMPMTVPTAFIPNDGLFTDQWGMVQIDAGGSGQTAWNIERGSADVIICVLDTGCDLDHPDLIDNYHPGGLNLGTMHLGGGPTGDHGTPCAGIAAARISNSEGVAGVAGGCKVLPVAFQDWTDVEVAVGIRYAALKGARVISMSFGWDPWDHDVIDPAIQDAFDADVVMCVATHNHNGSVTYPATNPLVMACGASDQVDERKSPLSPDGEWWGSNYGPEVSVVAPGVLIPSTDRTGMEGYNPAPGIAGNYVMTFNGTSAATPHVAGLAALLLSAKPSLSNVRVREIIEQTADKVGSVPYDVVPGYPNGTWNEHMGYGRINAHEALREATKGTLEFWEYERKWDRLYEEWSLDRFFKLERYKEKERLDELKSEVGYENPMYKDPGMFERFADRLGKLEARVNRQLGAPFIATKERPDVGRAIAGTARRTRRFHRK